MWDAFFSYHTGFVSGKIIVGREQIYAYSGNIISFIDRDKEQGVHQNNLKLTSYNFFDFPLAHFVGQGSTLGLY